MITLGLTCAVQALLILFLSGRGALPLGATFDLLIRIVGFISLGAGIGYSGLMKMSGGGILDTPLLYGTAVGSMALMAVALVKGPRLMRQYFIFAAGLFALALARPIVSLTEQQWPLLLRPSTGNRYFLFPIIAWWGVLFVLAGLAASPLRYIARVLLAITMLVAVPADWGDLFGFPPTDFLETAKAFDQAPPGTTMEFNQWPPGWKFSLTK
jgi:hypothetical protein